MPLTDLEVVAITAAIAKRARDRITLLAENGVFYYNESQQRDAHGRFGDGGGEVDRGSQDRPVKRADDLRKLQGQTQSNFVHPSTGAPMGKTETGDTYEEIFHQKGAALLEDKFGCCYQRIAGQSETRNSALDGKIDHSYGVELKTLSSRSDNQKTAIKGTESARKYDECQKEGVNPLLVTQVVDQDSSTVHVYAYKGFVSKAVSKMEYVGSYKYSQKDFRDAQKETGHWDKRTSRAALAAAGVPYDGLDESDLTAAGDWDESKHPRGAGGKFGDGSGEENSSNGGKSLRGKGKVTASFLDPNKVDTSRVDDEKLSRNLLGYAVDEATDRQSAEMKAKVVADLAPRLADVPTKQLVEASAGTAFGAVAAARMDHPNDWSVGYQKGTGVYGIYSRQDMEQLNKYGGSNRENMEIVGKPLDSPEGEQMLREGCISNMVQSWAISSNDSNAQSLFLQRASEQEFGLPHQMDWKGAEEPNQFAEVLLGRKDAVQGARAFLRAQYDSTQQYLKGAGVEALPLVRGMNWPDDGQLPAWAKETAAAARGSSIPNTPGGMAHDSEGEASANIEVPGRPMQAWSVSYNKAIDFATGGDDSDYYATQEAMVPRERIISCPRTGMGCLRESEFVVLAGKGKSKVTMTYEGGYGSEGTYDGEQGDEVDLGD